MDGSDNYVGRILDNRYEILECIGTGGMAYVYKARCHRLNRMVAIKVLKDELSGDEDFRRRFHTESQAVAMLSHPNIVAVYDVSRMGSVEYIVMELIEGITLKQYINRKGILNWKEVLHFTAQVCKGLSHAHSRGIIHRDIKPHNIMILKDGSVKVADFGIARLLSGESTLTQEALGSVHYISPEQAKGENVDARSDIYSLGVVMYEMLTSRLPFVGDSAVSVAIQHISAIPLMPSDINPDIPIGLEDITMHAMEPNVDLRFTSADEMQSDLEEFRKNPGMVFSYTGPLPKERQIRNFEEDQSTRMIPTGIVSLGTRTPLTRNNPGIEPSAVPVTARKPSNAANGKQTSTDRRISEKRPSNTKRELTADEYRDVKRRSMSTATLVGILGIIVVIIILVVFMWNYFLSDIFNPPEKEAITVPDFTNRKYEDIIRDDETLQKYSFSTRYEASGEVTEGIVIRQNPEAKTSINITPGRRAEIELIVSQGDEKPIAMPNLIDLHYSEARNRLVNLKLDLIIESEAIYSDVIVDYVIETTPEAGDTLARGNTVLIRYSRGQEVKTTTVPDMVGNTQSELETAFKTLHLTPAFQYFTHESDAGTVTFIEKVGNEVEYDTRIYVHISLGPPETESPTTEDPPLTSPDETIPPIESTSPGETTTEPTDSAQPPPTGDASSPPTDTSGPLDDTSSAGVVDGNNDRGGDEPHYFP